MKKKAARKKASKKRSDGMGALLKLLKGRPELVQALTMDQAKVKRLLRSRAARRLVEGVDARQLLQKRKAQLSARGLEVHPDCWANTFLLISWLFPEVCKILFRRRVRRSVRRRIGRK